LLHDCWKSHFRTPAVNHQLCTAHLLRELNYFIEINKDPWATKCRELIRDALHVKQNIKHEDYYNNYQPKLDILNRYDKLLEECLDEKIKDLVTFKKRLIKYKGYLFNFLNYPDVPPDNNGSERAIRNIKVKQKISGQFKSMAGAVNFATLRSITDTAIKNGQNILAALQTIACLKVYTD
jgi:transposase